MSDHVRLLPTRPTPTGRKIDGDVKGSLAKSLRSAARGEEVPTPAEAMQIEHARLLKAFRDAEGRDPNPSADPEFWKAYSTIQKMRVPGSEVRKDKGEEVPTRLRKRLADGPDADEPAWVRAVLEGRR